MKEYYENQLKNIITTICNQIGCDKCPDKWDGGCSAIELQNKIFEEENKDNQ